MSNPNVALVPQNTDGTVRFQKGQSGNPGGRPKGLVRAIRENGNTRRATCAGASPAWNSRPGPTRCAEDFTADDGRPMVEYRWPTGAVVEVPDKINDQDAWVKRYAPRPGEE